MVHDHQVAVAQHNYEHPTGCCDGDCAPGAYPGAAIGDLVHEDLRVQGAESDPGTIVHYGSRRWDTVDLDGQQTTYPVEFILETSGIVEWTLAEARTFLTEAWARLLQAEAGERDRCRTPTPKCVDEECGGALAADA